MITCKNCQSTIDAEETECIVCGYPIAGTREEQAKFTARQIIDKSNVKDSYQKMKAARVILFIIGGWYIIIPLTPLYHKFSDLAMALDMGVGVLFAGFALLSFKKPIVAVAIPLGMFLCYYTFLATIDIDLLVQGFVWKTITLVSLGYSLFSVVRARMILKKNPYLASVLGKNKPIKGDSELID